MTKDEVRTQLSGYLDGELAEAERRAVEEALAADADLRAELEGLRRTIALVGSLPRLGAPAGFGQRVEAAIRGVAEASPAAPHRWLAGWRPAALAAAAAALIAIAAALLLRPAPSREAARRIEAPRERGEAKKTFAPASTECQDALASSKLQVRKDAEAIARDSEKDKVALADADRKVEDLTRHRGAGYSGAPSGVAPSERSSLADGKGGAGGGFAYSGDLRKADKEATTALRESERGHAEGEKRELKVARPAAPKPAAAPAIAKSTAAPAAEALREEVAAQQKDLAYAGKKQLAPGDDEAKAGELAQDAKGQAAWDKRLAAERQDLLATIQENRPAAATPPSPPARTALPPRAVGAVAGPARNAFGNGRGETQFAYTDLARCLDEVQGILDAAALVYTVQPVGGGQFVIETTLPEPQAADILARISGTLKGKEKLEKAEAPKMGARSEPGRPEEQAKVRRAQAARTVHLVLRFARTAEAGSAATAVPAEPAPAQK